MKYTAIDTETTLIGRNNIIPDLICSGFYVLGEESPSVRHWSPKEAHIAKYREIYADPEHHTIYHNAAFDLTVQSKYDWDMLPLIWEAVEAGRVHDTMIREMLLNLTLTGSIDTLEIHGIKQQVRYALSELTMKYLQIDIKEAKEAEDSVRTNFEMVRYKPIEEWPEEFIKYAGEDPEYTGLIFLEQEKARQTCISETGVDPFAKEGFLVCTAMALQFMTAQGNKLDKEKVAEVTKEFLDHYDDPELVWPLVWAPYVHAFKQHCPEVREAQVISEAKKSWSTEDPKDLNAFKGKGLVIPAVPAIPFAKKTKEHLETCIGHKEHPQYKKGYKVQTCACPLKMKKAVPEKGSSLNLHQYIWTAARANPDIKVWLSDKTKELLKQEGYDIPHPVPQSVMADNEEIPMFKLGGKNTKLKLKADKEWLATYAFMDPVLSAYDERHKIQKIVSSYLPCMYWADEYDTGCPVILEGETSKFAGKTPADSVHAQFMVLKETGRTSSRAAKRGRGAANEKVLYPSWNGQQVDPRIRKCVVPEEGCVLFSIDYSAMELGTAAQVAYNLLGYEGVLMGLINSGKDTHAYLGAQIALKLDPVYSQAMGMDESDPMKSYEVLKNMSGKKDLCDSPDFKLVFEDCYLGKKWGDHVVSMEDCTQAVFYKHYRTFGKPTGLGFWGGLGEATFMSMARATYGIPVTLEIATILRQVWKDYIPEGQEYLNYVNGQMVDRSAAPEVYEDAEGRTKRRRFYCYDTPMGMHRAKCSYTAAANGCALQSPSAEGATLGVQKVMKACTVGELAGYVFPSLFIHDEIVGDIFYDDRTTERIQLMEAMMKESMEVVTPDVRASTEACLMRRWDKRAEPVFEDGKLIPWEG